MQNEKGLCIDCGKVPEWYMVRDDIWVAAGMPKCVVMTGTDFLCFKCLESRLGRILTPNDFTDARINWRWRTPRRPLLDLTIIRDGRA
jgi:hypothetical protein